MHALHVLALITILLFSIWLTIYFWCRNDG